MHYCFTQYSLYMLAFIFIFILIIKQNQLSSDKKCSIIFKINLSEFAKYITQGRAAHKGLIFALSNYSD